MPGLAFQLRRDQTLVRHGCRDVVMPAEDLHEKVIELGVKPGLFQQLLNLGLGGRRERRFMVAVPLLQELLCCRDRFPLHSVVTACQRLQFVHAGLCRATLGVAAASNTLCSARDPMVWRSSRCPH